MNDPELYKDANGLQRRDAMDTLSHLDMLEMDAGCEDVVLDLGCGSGDVTWELLRPKLPPKVRLIGADISTEMLKHTVQCYPHLDVICLDIGSSTISQQFFGYFNHIFSFYCLHWIKNQRQAFQNMHKLLKPGGNILICFLASNPIFDVYLNLSEKTQWKPFMNDVQKFVSPYHFMDDVESTLKKLLNETGFQTKICVCQKKLYEYPNINIAQKSMIAVNPFYAKIPDSLKEQFLTDYICELENLKMVEQNNNKFEKVSMVYKLITICAKKPII